MQNTGSNQKIIFSYLNLQVFYMAMIQVVLNCLNWQIFKNPENRGQFLLAY